METHYGYPLDRWRQAREETRQVLIKTARARSVISYTELCRQVTAIDIQPHHYALPHLLGEVSRSEHQAGRGLITVLIVYKDGDMTPGPGFFALARQLGFDTDDRIRFWTEQLQLVYQQWARDHS